MHLRALKSITIIYIFLILLEPSLLLLFQIGISRESFPLHCCRERYRGGVGRGGRGRRERERESVCERKERESV